MTPPIPLPQESEFGNKSRRNLRNCIYNECGNYKGYFDFACNVANFAIIDSGFKSKKMHDCLFRIPMESDVKYSLVSLNYDSVVENPNSEIDFNEESIIKIHGDINSDVFLPMTWAKSLDGAVYDEIRMAFYKAYNVLSKAHEIRFLGFSFPPTDTHIWYFIKAALARNSDLRSISAVCLDRDGSVKNKLKSMFRGPIVRFANQDILEYFAYIGARSSEEGVGAKPWFKNGEIDTELKGNKYESKIMNFSRNTSSSHDPEYFNWFHFNTVEHGHNAFFELYDEMK
jgi:hypothetical protein